MCLCAGLYLLYFFLGRRSTLTVNVHYISCILCNIHFFFQVTTILQEAGFTHVAVEVEVVASSDVVRETPPSQWGMGTLVRTHNNQYPSSIRAI